jgi:hypothetical protein
MVEVLAAVVVVVVELVVDVIGVVVVVVVGLVVDVDDEVLDEEVAVGGGTVSFGELSSPLRSASTTNAPAATTMATTRIVRRIAAHGDFLGGTDPPVPSGGSPEPPLPAPPFPPDPAGATGGIACVGSPVYGPDPPTAGTAIVGSVPVGGGFDSGVGPVASSGPLGSSGS